MKDRHVRTGAPQKYTNEDMLWDFERAVREDQVAALNGDPRAPWEILVLQTQILKRMKGSK